MPAVQFPAEREESVMPARRARPTPRVKAGPGVETSSKRIRVKKTPAAASFEGGAESSARVPAAAVKPDPSRPRAESPAIPVATVPSAEIAETFADECSEMAAKKEAGREERGTFSICLKLR